MNLTQWCLPYVELSNKFNWILFTCSAVSLMLPAITGQISDLRTSIFGRRRCLSKFGPKRSQGSKREGQKNIFSLCYRLKTKQRIGVIEQDPFSCNPILSNIYCFWKYLNVSSSLNNSREYLFLYISLSLYIYIH